MSISSTLSMVSGAYTPLNTQPPSPSVSLESWIVDVEDLQDKLDAMSIASSASSASRKLFGPFYNGKLILSIH